jgi:DNA-binding IclR family transcriptional regulator
VLGVQIMGLDRIVVVAAAEARQGFRLSTQVGSRFPALISATGRLIAAFGDWSPAELRPRFEQLRWDDPPGWEDWLTQVAQARAQGYAVDDGNYIAGVTVVAAPVWKAPGTPSHALVGIGIGGAVREGLAALGPELVMAASQLSRQLGAEV